MKILSLLLITAFGTHTVYSMNPSAQLQNAIQSADIALAEEALADQVNVNSRLPMRMYPLEFVVFKASQFGASSEDISNLTQIATLLLDRNADVNIDTGNGKTILHELADWIDAPISPEILQLAKLLLDRGANPNATTIEGETPLSVATFAPPAFIKLLLNRGADHTIIDRKGLTLLDKFKRVAADKRLTPAQRAYADAVVSLLENYQTLMQAKPDKNSLRQAIEQGFTKIVQKILRSGAPIELIDIKSGLDLAKQKYMETQDPSYQEIGRMLLQNLGLTGKETRVAQAAGVAQGLGMLPNEIIEYIRTFMQ